jgi:hypothetical protein
MSLNGFTQKIISAENPLEEILQKDFDSSILYSYSNRGYYHNYLIISKKDSLVYFYSYSSPFKNNFYFVNKAPYNSNIYSKLLSNQIEFENTEPNINSYFSWVSTKLSNESIWKVITKYNIWNLVDGAKLDSLDTTCETTTFGMGYEIFKLITKDKIIQLQYYDPKGQNEICKFNQTLDDIIKIEEIIFEYFNSKY